MNISDSKRDDIRALASEILDARSDEEFNEACRAIVAAISGADCDQSINKESKHGNAK